MIPLVRSPFLQHNHIRILEREREFRERVEGTPNTNMRQLILLVNQPTSK